MLPVFANRQQFLKYDFLHKLYGTLVGIEEMKLKDNKLLGALAKQISIQLLNFSGASGSEALLESDKQNDGDQKCQHPTIFDEENKHELKKLVTENIKVILSSTIQS